MLRSIFWKPYSRLFIIRDNAGWSIDVDAKDLKSFADKLGIPAYLVKKMPFNIRQAVHYTSQFSLQFDHIYKSNNRLSVDYYHGKPDQQESFRKCFEALSKHHENFGRVRVSTKEMEALIKTTGISPEKVMRIPIGVDLELFKKTSPEKRKGLRERLGIPQDAFVIGSFQKDGVGWGDGMEPKFIKGPDVFLEVIGRLKKEIPNLWVLLSGPSRGFVKNGLESLKIPYRHEFLKDFRKLPELYDAIDLYIITSREEGGPKACLESMAKGIPLVTTRVGQCADVVEPGKNAMMADIGDTESIAKHALRLYQDNKLRENLVAEGFKTADANSFDSQLPLWKKYFETLVN